MREFGFPFHNAPGEAEAECALMQKRGVVDAVLSEDVDTVMFGCTKSLRDWSSESKNSKTPTHVSVYDAKNGDLSGGIRLGREDMILVALMSGGDYLPDGIPGCGVKVACEAARAGYGKTLCRLKGSDKAGLQQWREDLSHELKTNESGYFRTKHKALTIPDDFPNLEVLRYYTNPVVSPVSTIDSLESKLENLEPIHLESLREYTREEFGWDFRIGAIKFIRVLCAALLASKLQSGEAEKQGLVKQISKSRQDFSTDAEPELRLAYIPSEVVPIDLSQEVDEADSYSRSGLGVNDEDLDEAADKEAEATNSSQLTLADVTKIDRVWVLEELASRTVAPSVSAWKESQALKAAVQKSPKKKRGTGAKSLKKTGMPPGDILAHFKVTKPSAPKSSAKSDLNLVEEPKPDHYTSVKTTRPRTSSKPSYPPTDQNKRSELDKGAGSPVTPPRTQDVATRSEPVLISSSPVRPTVSPIPRPCTTSSTKIFGDVRPRDPKITASQDMRRTGQAKAKATTKKAMQKPSSTVPTLKQTSITMFTSASKVSAQKQGSTIQVERVSQDTFQSTPPTIIEESYVDDSSIELPPLSSLLSVAQTSPKSPSKRQKSPAGIERDVSPTRGPRTKKKLFVPSTNGYMIELSIDAAERDDMETKEARRLETKGVQQRPIRMSDISVIDLTQE